MERCRNRRGLYIEGDNEYICMLLKQNVSQHQSRYLIATPSILQFSPTSILFGSEVNLHFVINFNYFRTYRVNSRIIIKELIFSLTPVRSY